MLWIGIFGASACVLIGVIVMVRVAGERKRLRKQMEAEYGRRID